MSVVLAALSVLPHSFLMSGFTFSLAYYSSWVSLNITFMRLVVLTSVLYVERNLVLSLSRVLVTLAARLFFGRTSLLIMFWCYELLMVPIVLGIFLYGRQPEKMSAIAYALIYTRGLSLPFLCEVIRLEGLMVSFYVRPTQLFICMGLFLGKSPIYLLHVWLPKTHVEAPTSVSILLAGILLKVGIFGLIKIVVYFNIVRTAVIFIRLLGLTIIPVVTSLSVERKVITAYSRVTHMNLVIYGLNVLSNIRYTGSYILRISHGFVRSIIFCLVGILYRMNGVRILFFITGLISWSMFFSISSAVIFLANAGTPPLMSFWGELLVLITLVGGGALVFPFLLVYLMYSFYYSIYIMMHLLKLGRKLFVRLRMLVVLLMRNLLVFNSLLFIV